MAFSNLSAHEKDAFFILLDELSITPGAYQYAARVDGLYGTLRYFSSRPGLLNGSAQPDPTLGTRSLQSSAASAAAHAVASNPQAASQLISHGLRSVTAPAPRIAPKPAPGAASDERASAQPPLMFSI
jgi:hypothetical protein